MLINPLLPSVSGNAGLPAAQSSRALSADQSSNANSFIDKVRLVFEAPAQATSFSGQTLPKAEDARAQAANFNLLLDQQESINTNNVRSPFTDAVSAYQRAEDAAQYARPFAVTLGSL